MALRLGGSRRVFFLAEISRSDRPSVLFRESKPSRKPAIRIAAAWSYVRGSPPAAPRSGRAQVTQTTCSPESAADSTLRRNAATATRTIAARRLGPDERGPSPPCPRVELAEGEDGLPRRGDRSASGTNTTAGGGNTGFRSHSNRA